MTNILLFLDTCNLGWLTILGWGLIPFILGWLLRSLFGGSSNDEGGNDKEELLALRRENANLKAKLNKNPGQLSKLQSQLSAKDHEISSLTSSLAAAKASTPDYSGKINSLQARIDELQAALTECGTQREALQAQNDDLYAEIKKYEGQNLGDALASNTSLQAKINELESSLHAARLEQKDAGDPSDLEKELRDVKNKLAAARSAQANAEKEAEALRAAQSAPAEVKEVEKIVEKIVEVPADTSALDAEITSLKAQLAAAAAPAAEPDNLTQIEGIGPKTNELFHNNGITTFQQISEMNEDSLRAVLEKGGNRFGILDPYTWPRQAQLILSGNKEELDAYQDYLIAGRDPARYAKSVRPEDLDLEAAAEVFGKKVALNDLKLVEGIGPKVEELLNANGINSWVDLAAAQQSTLRTLVDDNGYKYMEPASWPKQAAMLATGKWIELKKWQDEHDHGKE